MSASTSPPCKYHVSNTCQMRGWEGLVTRTCSRGSLDVYPLIFPPSLWDTDMLLTQPIEGCGDFLPSPNHLKRKIILKVGLLSLSLSHLVFLSVSVCLSVSCLIYTQTSSFSLALELQHKKLQSQDTTDINVPKEYGSS